MTYQSLYEAAPSVFGEINEYFLKIYFSYISDKDDSARIYLSVFLNKMMPFITVERFGIQDIIYKLYDADQNGKVSIVDLLYIKAVIKENTQFGQEVASLVNSYFND